MLRRMIIGSLTLLVLLGVARMGDAQVSVNIGINLAAPPVLVAVPASPVMYAPSVGANYFFYSGEYWVFSNGAWYASRGHDGPWAVVGPELVPRPILGVPVQYYRVPPPAWRGWRREAAPRWEARFGQRWEERRPVERADHHEGPGPRGEVRHEERHEDRR